MAKSGSRRLRIEAASHGQQQIDARDGLVGDERDVLTPGAQNRCFGGEYSEVSGHAGLVALFGQLISGLRIVQRSLLMRDLGIQRFDQAELVGSFAHRL